MDYVKYRKYTMCLRTKPKMEKNVAGNQQSFSFEIIFM